eukprot:TRINITY_DN3184_c0_g1_i1.p1 TRINITY_DN3184_c0_g1~~TRINITY_DN3184_c0_g1_i1.p1  ORF type:complete len:623 (-),score=170.89 TRINITY_DN3184_c0_g1_i1:283-2151(-)
MSKGHDLTLEVPSLRSSPDPPKSSSRRRSVGLFRRHGRPEGHSGHLDIKTLKKSRSRSTPCTPVTLRTGVNSLGGFSAIAAAATIGMETLGYEADLFAQDESGKCCAVSVILNDGEQLVESQSVGAAGSVGNSGLALSSKASGTDPPDNGVGSEKTREESACCDSVEDLCYESSDSSQNTAGSPPKDTSGDSRRRKKKPPPPPPGVTPDENLEEWMARTSGREMVDETLHMPVDTLFTYYFTDSKFFLDFHSSRKTSDIVLSPWSLKIDSEDKERVISFTISVTHPMGPKSSQVTETQTMKSSSRPGYYYMIDVDTLNSGIPYADSFYVSSSFCLSRVSEKESRLTIKSSINFKKTVWGMLKSFIDKNAWTGLEEFYGSLLRTLHSENELKRSLSSSNSTCSSGRKKTIIPAQSGSPNSHANSASRSSEKSSEIRADGRDRKKMRSGRSSHLEVSSGSSNNSESGSAFFPFQLIIVLLIALFLTNILLFVKIWNFESGLSQGGPGSSGGTPFPRKSPPYSLNGYTSYHLFQEDLLKLSSLPPPKTKEEWIQLLQKQELIHQMELGKWIELLEQVMTILRSTEKSLSDLEKNLHPWSLKSFRPSLFDKDIKPSGGTSETKEEL